VSSSGGALSVKGDGVRKGFRRNCPFEKERFVESYPSYKESLRNIPLSTRTNSSL